MQIFRNVFIRIMEECMKFKLLVLIILLLTVICAPCIFAEEAAENATAAANDYDYEYIRWISAALAVGLSCIAGGIAVGQIGAAAMAAMSENPELAGKALPYVGLAEGICLWGFIVALMILFV